MKRHTSRVGTLAATIVAVCATLALTPATTRAQGSAEWRIDPMRGPVDLGLTDPALVGAIDVHLHLDPDSPGPGNTIRILDVLEATAIAKARGMRGFVYKTHHDTGSAGGALLVRKRSPDFEIFGRMASNYSTGGLNPAALHHFAQIRGGWGRIFEMPTRDSITATAARNSMEPAFLARVRPWMLTMPPGTPPYIAVSKDGELLPEAKHLIEEVAKIRTVDTNARMVLATGHATPEEHLLLAREGRKHGLNVLLTHPLDTPHLAEAARLGAFIEVVASRVYRSDAMAATAAAFIRKVGAEHIIMATDCGQSSNVYPTDCLVLAARGLRTAGVTQRELDLMYKVNPAKLLGLPPPESAATAPTQVRQ
jgi:hypothetical protein